MKYVVMGKCHNSKMYWNEIKKDWYLSKYDATFYDDENSADSASILAEQTITMSCVDDIVIKKIDL